MRKRTGRGRRAVASEPQDPEGTPALRPAPTLSEPLTLPKQPDWKVQPCCPPAPGTQSQNTSTNSGKGPHENNQDVCLLIPTATDLLPFTFFRQRPWCWQLPALRGRRHASPRPGQWAVSAELWPTTRWTAVQRLPGVLERKGAHSALFGHENEGVTPGMAER